MSEETTNSGTNGEASKSSSADASKKEAGAKKEAPPAAAAAKPATPATAAPAAKAAEPPPPPEPGKFGKLLEEQRLKVTHLGPDAGDIEQIGVEPANLLEVAKFLRDNPRCRFDFLVSVTGVDWKDRLEAVYHLISTETFQRLILKVTADNEHIPSVMPVWPAADWHEREAYDLLGIVFDGHPDLRRILMPHDWIGHPLRKDYVENDPRLVWNRR